MSHGEPPRNGTEPGLGPGVAGSAHAVGEIVAGKYQLVRYLARGGMSEVWLATHLALQTAVAIKFVHPKLASDPDKGPRALERFRFEAQISARLGARTRHIVSVHDAGTHLGVPYLVMEYVEGRTLDAEIEATGPLSPERVADVLDQVADALGAAHALGIVHRDLKPSNLLLCDTGDPSGAPMVKVADFGVAKAVDARLCVASPRDTQRDEIVGSPAFMSPEQLRDAEGSDARADLWAMGAVAYEALTGRTCFDGRSIMDTFASITMGRYLPPSSVRPGLPHGVDAWFARVLAADPDARFASIDAMARSFRALLRRRRRTTGFPLIAAAVLFGVAALGVLLGARFLGEAPAAAPTVLAAAAPSSSAPAPAAPPPAAPPTAAPAEATASATAAAPAPSPPPPAAVGRRAAAPPTAPSAAPTNARPPSPPPRKTKGIDPSEIQ